MESDLPDTEQEGNLRFPSLSAEDQVNNLHNHVAGQWHELFRKGIVTKQAEDTGET